MPTSVLTRQRSWVARVAVLALFASLLVMGAVPASAAVNDTSASCPSSIPSAGFTDIATYDATTQAAINCIADYGITKGTSATTYGPAVAVARWQMALFLTRQAAVHGVTLPSGADQGFTDISGLDAATQTAINQLAQLGISKGTSATTFSPNDDVTREQMALFLARLLGAVTTLPASPASAGFTDITGLSAESQLAINQLAEVGVAAGTSATTYAPAADVLRWQMALFLTRVLAEDNIVPAGKGFIVVDKDAVAPGFSVSYADSAQGKVVKATLATGDKYFVDGTTATQAAFLLAASVGDLLDVSGQNYNLTNKKSTDYTSGAIANINTGAATFDIVEPISGTTLSSWDYDATVYIVLSSDGASVSKAAFDLDISIGDSVAVTGKGDGAANIRTFALTNGTASGTVDALGAGDFTIAPWTGDTLNVVAADTLTVDGASATEAEFEGDLSDGDSATYAKKGGKVTASLTNKAATATSGKVNGFLDDVNDTFEVDDDGTSVQVDYTGAVLIVDGTLAAESDFEDEITPGDSVVYQPADGVVNTTARVTLTSGAFTGHPDFIDTTDPVNQVAIEFTANGDNTEAVDYDDATALGFTGTTLKYSVNGTSKTIGEWEAAVKGVVDGGLSGTISVAQSGNDVTWTLTTP